MYGLVNKAVEDLVCTNFGEEKWEAIKEQAGVELDMFVRMDPYPDDITYKLVGAASDVLQMPAADILEAFGEYWTVYTAREGYGELLRMSGDTLPEFLLNLDNMHSRVGLSFPELQPPSFHCTDITENSLQLHYYTNRAGLAPMVIGLLKGLGKLFETEIEIAQTKHRDQGDDHDVFLIRY